VNRFFTPLQDFSLKFSVFDQRHKERFLREKTTGKKRLIILAALFHPNFRIRFLSSVCSLEAAGRGKKLSGFLITGLPFC